MSIKLKLCLQCNNELHQDNMLHDGKNVQVCIHANLVPFLRKVRG